MFFCEFYEIFKNSLFYRTPLVVAFNTPLEGFAKDAPQEELAIAPVLECLTTTAWHKYHQ